MSDVLVIWAVTTVSLLLVSRIDFAVSKSMDLAQR